MGLALAQRRAEQGLEDTKKERQWRKAEWNPERSCGDRYCVIFSVSHLRAEAQRDRLGGTLSKQSWRGEAGHCSGVMMLGKGGSTGDSDFGFFSGT